MGAKETSASSSLKVEGRSNKEVPGPIVSCVTRITDNDPRRCEPQIRPTGSAKGGFNEHREPVRTQSGEDQGSARRCWLHRSDLKRRVLLDRAWPCGPRYDRQ